MMYRPPADQRLWDTWIFPADDVFHLYHLMNPVGGPWNALGHAVSRDLVHWSACDPIPMRGADGSWDSGPLLTGMVFRHGGGFAMTFGSVPPGGKQKIGIMFSPDLYHWGKYVGNPVLEPVAPYLTDGPDPDWRDAYVMGIEGGYEALICARMPDGRACIARMRSADLIRWEALPPIATPPVSQCEVPEYFQLGDRHYLIFACGGRIDDRSRRQTAGTRYLVSDRRDGDYVMPEDSLLIGSGNGRFDCYVGRTIEVDGERLLYYHNCGPRPAAAAPKRIRQNRDGTLRVEYWDGLARLETRVILDGFPPSSTTEADWQLSGDRLVGRRDAGISATIPPTLVSDFHLTCAVTLERGKRSALLFRYDDTAQRGSAIVFDAVNGYVEIARIAEGEPATLDAVEIGLERGQEYRVRLYARSEFVDCYVNDRLLFSTVVDHAGLLGKIGFAVDSGVVSFRDLRVAALENE